VERQDGLGSGSASADGGLGEGAGQASAGRRWQLRHPIIVRCLARLSLAYVPCRRSLWFPSRRRLSSSGVGALCRYATPRSPGLLLAHCFAVRCLDCRSSGRGMNGWLRASRPVAVSRFLNPGARFVLARWRTSKRVRRFRSTAARVLLR